VLLVGPRQVGKTTLLWQLGDELLEQGAPARAVVQCNFEDARFLEPPSLDQVVDAAGPAATTGTFFLFDEVRFAPGWDRSLKRLVDARAGKFVVTDSAAGLLRDRAPESGVGRWDEVAIPPLSFADFLAFRRPSITESLLDIPAAIAAPELDAYIERGGFPEHVVSGIHDAWQVRERIRTDVAERAIERDLFVLLGLRNSRQLRGLFAGLAAESGTVFDASARARDLGMSRQTVDGWLDVLDRTGLLLLLRKRVAGARKAARAHPKVYAADPGICAAFSSAHEPLDDPDTVGRLVETAAHRHLSTFAARHRLRLTFHREGDREVDFVVDPAGRALFLEVHAGRVSDRQRAFKTLQIAASAGGVAAIASRIPETVTHSFADGKVREVPLAALLLRLELLAEPMELFAWLTAA
jgi:predicted AAA+ superfamily ATPase